MARTVEHRDHVDTLQAEWEAQGADLDRDALGAVLRIQALALVDQASRIRFEAAEAALAGLNRRPVNGRILCLVFALLLGLLLTAGCSPLQTLSKLSDNGAYRRVPDLAYGPEARQRLDLYLPQARDEAAPLVLFFYGGGWRRGARESYEFVAAALAEDGFVVAVPDYRVWPEVRYPAFVEDGAAALAWLAQTGPRYGVNADRQVLMGHSAGAHIAALLALDPARRASAGAGDVEIAGLVGLAGPYDFLPLDEDSYLQEVFPPDTRAASQPIGYVSPDDPPALLIHGADDSLVEPGNSERLAQALAAAGVDVTLRIYADEGHASVAAALAPPLEFVAETRSETLAFLRRVGAAAPAGSSAGAPRR